MFFNFKSASPILLLLLVLGVGGRARSQDAVPAVPADQSLVYFTDEQGKLSPIPFEVGHTPLNPLEIAKEDKTSYVEVPGPDSKTTVRTSDPRIYLFVSGQPNTHPAFLVQFIVRKGLRRVTALTERGRSGYAIASEQIVKPHYRVLANQNGMLFMEIRPRTPLAEGEYAIMGSDLSRVATFRVGR